MHAFQMVKKMSKWRKYIIIIGSKSFFDHCIKDIESSILSEDLFLDEVVIDTFLDLVKISDEKRNNGLSDYFKKASIMILKNDNYHGIVESAHDRLGSLIEDLTEDHASIVIHNPPTVLHDYLISLQKRELIELDFKIEKYDIIRAPNLFSQNIGDINNQIYGQENAIYEVSKSLWYLSTANRKKPYVIMLYGESSLGKSELVREISKKFYNGMFLEKHLSMFKNENYYNYFFGDKPNRRSLGFDLLERESNLVFLDEFDKCPEYFYSVFYTLFDNTIFIDSTYKVDISGLFIILTSNYKNEEEMKKHMGLPIYYRIDKYIHFDQLDVESIYNIVSNEINRHCEECEGKFSFDDVYNKVSKIIDSKGENARTVKNKVQTVIEEILFSEIIRNIES